jgi:hypothetical protein
MILTNATPTRPAFDLEIPVQLETATFALG